MKHHIILKLTFVLLASSACLPAHLQKYSKKGGGPVPTADESARRANSSMFGGSKEDQARAATSQTASQATIYAIDRQTYRFLLKADDVWDTALSVLLRNYNLTIVDKDSGVVTTEWDSFYLDNQVYRNKISIRLRRLSYNQADITIRNNVERLHDASEAAGAVGAVWLPSEDVADEVSRVVQNMAIVLNQPPPILPPGQAVVKQESAPPLKKSY